MKSKDNGNPTNRNITWDIAKGLGILFVVAGHAFPGRISDFVNLFHIPLFFFVSGLVFKFKDGTGIRAFPLFFLKNLKGLWLPSVLYGSFYVLCHNLFVKIGLYKLPMYNIKSFAFSIGKHLLFLKTEPLESAFWFLTALFVGRCLLWGILWISSQANKHSLLIEIVLVSVAFVLGCFLYYVKVGLPGNLDTSFSMLPILYSGYKLKKVKLTYKVLIIPSFIILFVLMYFGTLRMSRNEMVNPAFFLLSSTAGICMTFIISSLIEKNKMFSHIFTFLGQNTVPILCLHLLAFRVVSYIWVYTEKLDFSSVSNHPIVGPSLKWGVFYLLAGMILPLFVPITKKLIFKRLEKRRSNLNG